MRALIAHVACVFLIIVFISTTHQCQASEKNQIEMAVYTLDTYCLSLLSNIPEIEKRAAKENFRIVIDRAIPLPNNQVMKQKNWLVPSASGSSIMLTTTDSINGTLHVFGCGIYVPDIKGPELEVALSHLPILGLPANQTQSSIGSFMVLWSVHIGKFISAEDPDLLLSRNVPGLAGINVSLVVKKTEEQKNILLK